MAEKEVGFAGKDLGGAAAQLLHVVHHVPPALLLSQVDHGAVFNQGLSVAQVVVGHHHEAMAAQILGEGCVARAVLGHAVGDLDHARDAAAGRRPLVDMDQGFAVAGREEIFRYNRHIQLLRNSLI